MSGDTRRSTLLLTLLSVGFVGFFLLFRWVFGLLPPGGHVVAFTNIATIGGVAAGLSLVGFGMIVSGSSAMARVRRKYGKAVGLTFIIGHILVLFSALAVGMMAGFPQEALATNVAAASATLITGGLCLTALFLNLLYGWEASED